MAKVVVELAIEFTIQVLLLPAGVLAAVGARKAGRLTVFLQRGLSSRTAAAVLAEAIEEAQRVRP